MNCFPRTTKTFDLVANQHDPAVPFHSKVQTLNSKVWISKLHFDKLIRLF